MRQGIIGLAHLLTGDMGMSPLQRNKQMKKLLFTLFATLTALQGWSVDQQIYTDPSQLPPAFEWEVVRNDYWATSPTGEQTFAGTHEFKVIWDPTSVNSAGGYGKLTLENFYEHPRLKKVCTMTFDNLNHNCNFQWNESKTQCTFSLTPFFFSEAYNGNLTSAAGSKSAIIASAEYKTNSSQYWIKPSYVVSNQTYPSTNYKYGSMITFKLDIETNEFSIENDAWGVFMCYDANGASPSRVLEYFVNSVFQVKPPTTLAWIEGNGEVNNDYTVADQLVAVYAQEGSLWCKDQGNISNVKSTNPGNTDYMKALLSEWGKRDPSLEWDQSNWVELDFGAVTSERAAQIKNTYEGKTLKVNSVKGVYVDDKNYRIQLSQDPEVDDDLVYAPNYYCPVNFMGATDVTTANGKKFYFLNPKVQEYTWVTMAVWKGGDVFVTPAKDDEQGVNGAALSGAFRVNLDLNVMDWEALLEGLSTSQAYEFHAIIRKPTTSKADGPARATSVEPMDVTPTDDFVVYPLDLTASGTNIVTGLSQVRTDRVDDGYYYTITGQRVSNPAPGFYIRGGKKVIVR